MWVCSPGVCYYDMYKQLTKTNYFEFVESNINNLMCFFKKIVFEFNPIQIYYAQNILFVIIDFGILRLSAKTELCVVVELNYNVAYWNHPA